MWEYCGQARYIWNLAWEQRSYYRKYGTRTLYPPNFVAQCKQLAELRAELDWLKAGSQNVQEQALKDFNQAMTNFFKRTHKYPKQRKREGMNGFRITHVKPHHIVKLNKKWGHIFVPKVGKVKFRWTRDIEKNEVKSYRVTKDPSGRWHIAFALTPTPLPGPNTGSIVGIDRGVVHMATTNDETFYDLSFEDLDVLLKRAQKKLSRCVRGSNRRKVQKRKVAKLHARIKDRRRDAVEQATTELAKLYDFARLENLNLKNMTKSVKGTVEEPGSNVSQKSGLNRAILAMGWGMFAARLEYKMGGRVEYVPAEYTSQRCSDCGHTDKGNRESQASFLCLVCGFSCNADVNAARNIAAGLAVYSAVRLLGNVSTPTKREPLQPATSCL